MCGVAFDDDDRGGRWRRWPQPDVELPGGGRLHIQPTPALVAIDVDAGGAVAARQGKTAAHLAANRAMLPELARQIRLRNLSGAILVDFAGLPSRRRAALGPALARRAGGRSAAPAAARLHRAGPGGNRAAAHSSAAARTARGTACRRPGGVAPDCGRGCGAAASVAGAASVARDRQRRCRAMPRRWRTLRVAPDVP